MRASEAVVLAELLGMNGVRVLREGWPDSLVITSAGRFMGVEVKSTGGRGWSVSEGQRTMFAALEAIGLPVRVALVCGPARDQVRTFRWQDCPVRRRASGPPKR